MSSVSEVNLRKYLLPDVFGNKNPDIRINNSLIGDIKTLDKKTLTRKATISNAISRAAVQKICILVLNLSECQYTVQDVKKRIIGALQPDRNKSIKSVWIITRNRNLFIVDRKDVFDDSVYDVLNIP